MTTLLLIALMAVAPATRPATRVPTTSPTTQRRGFEEAKRIHANAMAKAQEQYLLAQLSAKKTYLSDLSAAITAALRSENLPQANEAKSAREKAEVEIEQLQNRLKGRPAMPVGTWELIYTNGSTRRCRIAPDGQWTSLDPDGTRTARVRVSDAGELLINFKDGELEKIERLMMTTGGLLVIEHFNPASQFHKGPPIAIAIGRPLP